MRRKGIYKLLSLILAFAFIFSGFIGTGTAKAENVGETILLSEGFDNGLLQPAGWAFEGINGIYANAGEYGAKTPSLKFDSSQDRITTPVFSNPSQLTFWIKGMSQQKPDLMILILKGGQWESLDLIKSIANELTVKTYPLDKNVTQIKFMHVGNQGEFALDDVKVIAGIPEVNPTTGISQVSYVRTDSNNDGISDFAGNNFSIQGKVTAVFGSVPSVPFQQNTSSSINGTVISNQAFYNTIYVQDETGGIALTGFFTKNITLGMTIKATGKLYQSEGEARLAVENENSNINIADTSVKLVEPKTMKTNESVLEANEGWLVRVSGKVTRIIQNGLFVDDGTGEARVLADSFRIENINYSNAQIPTIYTPSVQIGDMITVAGISSEDKDGHKIKVRNTSEIVKGIPDSTNKIVPARLNKASIVINQGKFAYVNIITTPGNAVVGSVSWNKPSIVTVYQDKKNRRLLKIVASQAGTQIVEINVPVNGKPTTLKLTVKVLPAKAQKGNGKK